MDLDTIIYIVATIVIFIVSLLGQKKKKNNLPVQSETDDIVYSLNDFEKILQRKEEFDQVQEIENEKKTIEESVVSDKIEEKMFLDEDFAKATQRKREKRIEKEKKKKFIDKEEKEDGFDLNSAVIYSSILERKKFRH